MNGLKLAPVTSVVVAACVAVYLVQILIAPGQGAELIERYALVPERFQDGGFASWSNVASLFGHAFIHAGFLHLAVNMFVFLDVAPFVEQRLGGRRFALLYLLSILGGAVAYIVINPDSAAPAVGASGAVCGVYAAFFLAVRPSPRAAVADPRVRNAMLWFVGINVVLMALLPLPIAWEAHLGGFIAGGGAYVLLAPRRRRVGPWG
ncbi:MAG: rhomboid family intramembrane serine protease [Caulobacteraceae bacterium]